MADIDVISLDSEGESEEHAVVISDTEDDVIFIGKIDAHPKNLSLSGTCESSTTDVKVTTLPVHDNSQDLIVLSKTKDSPDDVVSLEISDAGSGRRLLPSCDESNKAMCELHFKSNLDVPSQPAPSVLDDLLCPNMSPDFGSACSDSIFSAVIPSSSSSLNTNTAATDLPPSKRLQNASSDLVSDGKTEPSHSRGSCSDDDDDANIILSNDGSDSDSDDSSLSSFSSSVNSDSDTFGVSSGSSSESDLDNFSISSETSTKGGATVVDTSPAVPPTPIFDKLIQFPSLERDNHGLKSARGEIRHDEAGNVVLRNGNISSDQLVSIINQSENSVCDLGAESSKLTSGKTAVEAVELVIPCKRFRTSKSPDGKSLSNLVLPDRDKIQERKKLTLSKQCQELHDECNLCEKLVDTGLLVRCPCGRNCCAQCIEKQITTLLATGKKGLPKCASIDCNGICEMDKLAKFLPPMVMVILRKKIEEETIGDIMQWLIPRKEESSKRDLDNILGLPEQWQPMTECQDYVLVDVPSASVEYIEIRDLFHMSMLSPRAEIQAIKRVQNPNLWRFYAMKRHIMMKDVKCPHDPPIERRLFHGTKSSNTDSICRDNFDWRLSGVHGTAYGIGSYFAHEASYSHRFTDQSRILHQPRPVNLSLHIFQPSVLTSLSIVPPQPLPIAGLAWSSQMLMTNSDPMLNQDPRNLLTNQKHHHVMFVAKVLTGRYTLGRSEYRKPPKISEDGRECYDSCVNSMAYPEIFVIFEKSQCYPEYVIEYTNEFYRH